MPVRGRRTISGFKALSAFGRFIVMRATLPFFTSVRMLVYVDAKRRLASPARAVPWVVVRMLARSIFWLIACTTDLILRVREEVRVDLPLRSYVEHVTASDWN